jgi:Transcriptional regulator of RNA polII, SAGA, subunit
MSTQRIDLLVLKNKLGLVLKEKAPLYWDALRKFVQSKLTKVELDRRTRSLLQEKHCMLEKKNRKIHKKKKDQKKKKKKKKKLTHFV